MSILVVLVLDRQPEVFHVRAEAFVVQRIGILVAGSLLLAVGVGGLAVTTPDSAPSPASAVSEGAQR